MVSFRGQMFGEGGIYDEATMRAVRSSTLGASRTASFAHFVDAVRRPAQLTGALQRLNY